MLERNPVMGIPQKVRENLEARITNNPCPSCGGKVHDCDADGYWSPYRVPPEGGTIMDGAFIPMIAVACRGCGHTRFYNALRLGYQPPSE